jgi:NitT/TauT family transport system substrate-binding protein
MIYNNAPFVLAAMKDGPIKTIADLEGHSLGSPAGSAALALMPTIESINHIDPKTVKIVNMAPNLLEQMLAKKQVDVGVTYNITTYMNLFAMHVDPETEVRWFYFKDFGIDLYSNGVMVSKALLRDKPDAVRGLVRAINHAIKDVAANPDEGIAAVAEREPLLDRKIEKLRMLYAFKTLMDTPEVKANGLGDVTDAKLASSIDLITKTFALPRRPESSEIFDRSFLPPKSERETTFPPS